jgi:hypothetical protein
MRSAILFSLFHFFKIKRCVIILLIFVLSGQAAGAQNIEAKVIAYNTLVGGLSGGIGALINKKKGQKWHKVFAKGFIVGLGGGAIAYSGKKMNSLVAKKQNLAYCWLSRAVFSAGNSIVENAAANRDFWSQWHYDLAFVRLELKTNGPVRFMPKIMPSALGGIVFMGCFGKLDLNTSLRSGTVTFRTHSIDYAPNLVASTASNGFLFVDTLRMGRVFYDTYAHEMIHGFQFQEFSGINNFFIPFSDKWIVASPLFRKTNRWIYRDLNYEAMLFNYFIIQQGYKDNRGSYCRNYLENEAEFLSVGRSACFP